MSIAAAETVRRVWRCPVPSKVYHAFEIPPARADGSKGRRRGVAYTSLCGQAELRALRKQPRELEVLLRCEECAAQAARGNRP